MKNLKKMKLAVILLTILSLVYLNIGKVQAVMEGESTEEPQGEISGYQEDIQISKEPGELTRVTREPKAPEYAPGELIVNLKEDFTLEDIQELNAKYNVTSTEKIFKDTSDSQETLEELKDQLSKLESKDHDAWYWQLDKESQEYKDYIAKIEKEKEELKAQIQAQEELLAHLEQRQKRAPEGVTVPDLTNVYLLKTSQETGIPAMALDYQSNPAVEYAEPNYIAKVQMIPNDPYYSSANSWGQGYDDLWGLKKMQTGKAWDISQGEGVIVAVVDTGIDYNHEDIKDNLWKNPREIPNNNKDDDSNGYVDDYYGYDFAYADSDPKDGHGHGTHVAGTIAAVGNNSKGIIGVAPKAKAMAIKGLNDSGSGSVSDLANCLKYAADMGADVINNSWGGEGRSSIIEVAVNYAYAKGCVVVAAAGNSSDNVANFFPANIGNVITVAASDHNDDQNSDFSNFGFKIDVAAPGGDSSDTSSNRIYRNILSLRANGTDMYGDGKGIVGTNYYRARGTSMAAPHVAGVAALVLSKHPEFTAEEVKSTIMFSADDIAITEEYIGFDLTTGHGRVNAQNALQITSPKVLAIKIKEFITGQMEISGSVYGPGLWYYTIEWAKTDWGLWIPDKFSSQYIMLKNNGRTEVRNGLLGTLNSQALEDGQYVLRLTAVFADGSSKSIYSPLFIIDNRLADGWPYQTDGEIISSPIITDLENDGQKELIITSYDSKVYVFNEKGEFKQGWPVFIKDINHNDKEVSTKVIGFMSPATADINGDGDLEIVVRSGNFAYVFNKDGALLPGWPVSFEQMYDDFSSLLGAYSAPVIADINKDGKLDIVITGSDKKIYVFQKDGTYLPGWPKQIDITLWRSGFVEAMPVVGDLDGDGYLEIVIKEYNESSEVGKVNVFHYNGISAQGWPQNISLSTGGVPPILGDLDGDGRREVITECSERVTKPCGKNICSNYYSRVYVWHADGTLMKGWPKIFDFEGSITGLALADINKDNRVELIVSVAGELRNFGSVYVVDSDGQVIWKAEGKYSPQDTAPIVADINGDGSLEVIINGYFANTGVIAIYDKNGAEIKSLSRRITDPIIATHTLGDLDGDGKLELAVGTQLGRIFVWNFDGELKKGNAPWPTFQHNFQRTGCYPIPDKTPPTTPVVTDEGLKTNSTTQLTASWSSSDPESGIAEYQYRITQDSITGTVIRGWTSTKAISVMATGLTLIRGKTYYFGVKAKNGADMWSNVGYSDGIKVNILPVAKIIANQTSGTTPLRVYFRGDSSYDPDGRIVSYFWDFGDGRISNQINPNHAFGTSSTKTYTVTLTVKDDNGAISTAQVIITVYLPPPPQKRFFRK